jgi:hypothetical protein
MWGCIAQSLAPLPVNSALVNLPARANSAHGPDDTGRRHLALDHFRDVKTYENKL